MTQGETPMSESVMEKQTHKRATYYSEDDFGRATMDGSSDQHADVKQDVLMSNNTNPGKHIDDRPTDALLQQRLDSTHTTPTNNHRKESTQQYTDSDHVVGEQTDSWWKQRQRKITRVPLKSEKKTKQKNELKGNVNRRDDNDSTEDEMQTLERESPMDETQTEDQGSKKDPVENQEDDQENDMTKEDNIMQSEAGIPSEDKLQPQEELPPNSETQHEESDVFVASGKNLPQKSGNPTETITDPSMSVSEEKGDQKEKIYNTGEHTKGPDGEEATGNVKLKTLADLISVCRHKGLQVYNDVSHRPEQDVKLYSDADIAALDDLGPPRGRKRHRRDERSSKGSASTSRVGSRRRNTMEDDMTSTSGFSVPRNRLGTATSYATSYSNRTGTTRLESRMSYRSREERRYAYTDVDADEALQQRMWEKSKRRRKQKHNLLDVVKQKETSVAAASAIIDHLRKTGDTSKVADANGKCSFNPDRLNDTDDNYNNVFVTSEETMETNGNVNEANAKVIITEAEVYNSNTETGESVGNIDENDEVNNDYKEDGRREEDDIVNNESNESNDTSEQQNESNSDNMYNEENDANQNEDVDSSDRPNDVNKNDNVDSDAEVPVGECNTDALETEDTNRTMNTDTDIDIGDTDHLDTNTNCEIKSDNNCDNEDENNENSAMDNGVLDTNAEDDSHEKPTHVLNSEPKEDSNVLDAEPASANQNDNTLADNANTDPGESSEIQEFRITDGTTTLILYRLKTEEIADPKIREEILRESRAINNGNLLQDIQSLINDDPRSGSANNRDKVQISCSDDSTSVNSNTSTANPVIGDTENGPQGTDINHADVPTQKTQSDDKNCGSGEEQNPTTPPGSTAKLKESAMEVEKHRNTIKDLQRSENVRSNDSGIGSDSEKESLSKAEHNEHVGKQKYKTTMQKSEDISPAMKDSRPGGTKDGQKNGSKAKRSLGNGFLVSSDGEDDDSARGGKTSTQLSDKQANTTDKQTRMVYLMEKIRQRYEEEKETQTVYLQKISDTRRELKQEYRDLKHDLKPRQPPEPPAEQPAEPTAEKPPAEKTTARDQPRDYPRNHPRGHPRENPRNPPRDHPGNHQRDPRDHPGNHPRDHPGNHPRDHPGNHARDHPGNHPRDHPGNHPRDHPGNHPRGYPREHPRNPPRDPPHEHPRNLPREHPRKKVKPLEPEPEPEEKTVRKVVTSKIDSSWSKDHPLYKQIKSGFKSNVKIPNTTRVQYVLKDMRNRRMSRSTSNLDSVYVEEAKRLHPKFFSREDLDYIDDRRETRAVAKSKVRHNGDTDVAGERNGKYMYRDRSPEKYTNETDDRVKPRSKSLNDRNSRPDRNRHDPRETETVDHVSEARTRAKEYSKSVPRPKPAKTDHADEEREPKTLYERLQERSAATSEIPQGQGRSSQGEPRKYESNSGPPSIRGFDSPNKDERSHRKRTKNHVTGNGAGSSLTSGSTSSVRSISTATQTPSGEVPMSLAVDIVQSRNKFYSERFGDEVTPRENRVCKLYRDLQHIRQRGNADSLLTGTGSSGYHVTDSLEAEGDKPPFLLMNYEDFRTPIRQQKTDKELNNFLYGSLNYELCSKGRQLYAGPEKKEKALAILRQKVNKTALY